MTSTDRSGRSAGDGAGPARPAEHRGPPREPAEHWGAPWEESPNEEEELERLRAERPPHHDRQPGDRPAGDG